MNNNQQVIDTSGNKIIITQIVLFLTYSYSEKFMIIYFRKHGQTNNEEYLNISPYLLKIVIKIKR